MLMNSLWDMGLGTWDMNFYISTMFRVIIVLASFALLLLSCEKKEANSEKAVIEKAVGSYGALIEKAKETEATLQKKADSIARLQDSLGIPR